VTHGFARGARCVTIHGVEQKVLNLEVAVGWLQYAGLKKIAPIHIDQGASLQLHLEAGGWAEEAAEKMSGVECLHFDHGECCGRAGNFVGRFVAVKLSDFWTQGCYGAVAASVLTPGGEVRAGVAVLSSRMQVVGLSQDIGRGLCLASAKRREAVMASMSKWEAMNPAGWVNPFKQARGWFGRAWDRIQH
jgi:hypothetical protein